MKISFLFIIIVITFNIYAGEGGSGGGPRVSSLSIKINNDLIIPLGNILDIQLVNGHVYDTSQLDNELNDINGVTLNQEKDMLVISSLTQIESIQLNSGLIIKSLDIQLAGSFKMANDLLAGDG